MKFRLKCLLCLLILTLILLNIYLSINTSGENLPLNSNEFLVLDWTAIQHIFQEQDPISCNFSHITFRYCQTKFRSIEDFNHRSELIQQCLRLSTLSIRWTRDRSRLQQANLVAFHSIHLPGRYLPKLRSNQFSMVYVLESEVHSTNGEYWHRIDFSMWYHLNYSYPEPITYFDLQLYLQYLFAPSAIHFSKKNSIVWISSNCNAYNGRAKFIQKLMTYIPIDSLGHCLNNKEIPAEKSISQIYSTYKFVIVIENSNCEDYITEKLIQAFQSTSIPIVAGRNNKPDYTQFAPKHSYINIYDYSSIKELADYLNYLLNNEAAYSEYLWFRQETSQNLTLNEYLQLADRIFGVNSSLRRGLLTKETSRNKYCKLTEFIYTTDWQNPVNRKKPFNRPSANNVCLPENDLGNYFS